jgi:NADH-quinone oxidoreductase subunit M
VALHLHQRRFDPGPVHEVAPPFVLLLLVILLGVHPDLIYGMIQDAVGPLLPLVEVIVA